MSADARGFLHQYNGKEIQLVNAEGIPPPGVATQEMYKLMYGEDNTEFSFKEFVTQYLHRACILNLPDAGKYKGAPVNMIPGHVIGSPNYGPYQADIAIVCKGIDAAEAYQGRLFSGDVGRYMYNLFKDKEIDIRGMYVTSVTKFAPPYQGMGATPAAWTRECAYFLYQELLAVKPKYVLLLGGEALKAVFGKSATVKAYRGTPTDIPWLPGTKALIAGSPNTVLRNPEKTVEFMSDIDHFITMIFGGVNPGLNDCEYETIWDDKRLSEVVKDLMRYRQFAVDVETTGLDCREGELLTIQICPEPKKAYCIALQSKTSGKRFSPSTPKAIRLLRKLLCRKDVVLVGHNFRFDMSWLTQVGLDLSDQFISCGFDTMLASHTLYEVNNHDLSSCTLRDTNMGRYDSEMEKYKSLGMQHYQVPDEVLHYYGCGDVDATIRLYQLYSRQLWDAHVEYCVERKLDPYKSVQAPCSVEAKTKGYAPTLWNLYRHVVIPVNAAIMEMELVGFPIDKDRLIEMITKFSAKRDELERQIQNVLGIPDFNPRSPKQCQTILFGDPNRVDDNGRQLGCLGYTPVKTTGKRGKQWTEVEERGEVWYEADFGWESNQHSPAVDGEVLAILADEQGSEVSALLKQFRCIDQICKNFLIDEVEDKATGEFDYYKGLVGLAGRDNRLHTSIAQTTDTGRWSSSKPNCFSGDTCVLTNRGWIQFSNLNYEMNKHPDLMVAQYDKDKHTISFARPTGYVEIVNADNMVDVSTKTTINMRLTADHQCLLRSIKTDKFKFVDACNYGRDHYQIQAANYTDGKVEIDKDTIALNLAIYYKASVHPEHSDKWSIKLYSRDKRARLKEALNNKEIEHTHILDTGQEEFIFAIRELKNVTHNHLNSSLFSLSTQTIAAVIDELLVWKGYKTIHTFITEDKEEAEWFQIACILCNRVAKLEYKKVRGKYKWTVHMSIGEHRATTNNVTVEKVPNETAYCVSMPLSTIVVSRKGRVAITGQCQNIPKGKEGEIATIFGAEDKVPPIRSGLIAEPGHVLIEADFKSAETFTLAYLADDPVMKSDLSQVDKNGNEISLHSVTALNIFKLPMTLEEFEERRKDDKRLGNLRVAAKSVNFGIPYGRSGTAISRAVMREGVDCKEEDGNQWVSDWYTRYKKCGEFLESCKTAVEDPGYIVTPWGRRRRFILSPHQDVNAAMAREASNFPMQSTVADAINEAAIQLRNQRNLLQLKFRLILAVHDAIVLHVPFDEVQIAMELLQKCMSDDLEVPGTGLHYGIDIEIGDRWCEKPSKELLSLCGIGE